MNASAFGATGSTFDSAQQGFADQLVRFTRFQTQATITLVNFKRSPFADIPNYLHLAKHLLLRTVLDFDGNIFHLADDVYGCIGDQRTAPLINETIEMVTHLLSDGTWEWYAKRNPKARFCATYEMPYDHLAVESQLARLRASETNGTTAQLDGDNASPSEPQARRHRRTSAVMDLPAAVQLDFIENQLREIDFLRMVRTQPLCRLKAMNIEAIEGQEIFTSIMDLQKRFSTHIEPDQHYLLFNHLTRYLDRFMFAEMAQGTLLDGVETPHINLALDSVNSNGFGALDAALTESQRSRMTFEINCTDALASGQQFVDTIARLRGRGYKIALDSVPFEMLEYLAIESLPVDMVKLIWRRDLIVTDHDVRQLNHLRDTTRAKLVLTRCDHRAALRLGAELDMDLYQGALIDRLATSYVYIPCETATAHGCTIPDCRNRHWAPHRMSPDSNCPRRTWTAPLPASDGR